MVAKTRSLPQTAHLCGNSYVFPMVKRWKGDYSEDLARPPRDLRHWGVHMERSYNVRERR
jgi:hypothetical protein